MLSGVQGRVVVRKVVPVTVEVVGHDVDKVELPRDPLDVVALVNSAARQSINDIDDDAAFGQGKKLVSKISLILISRYMYYCNNRPLALFKNPPKDHHKYIHIHKVTNFVSSQGSNFFV